MLLDEDDEYVDICIHAYISRSCMYLATCAHGSGTRVCVHVCTNLIAYLQQSHVSRHHILGLVACALALPLLAAEVATLLAKEGLIRVLHVVDVVARRKGLVLM